MGLTGTTSIRRGAFPAPIQHSTVSSFAAENIFARIALTPARSGSNATSRWIDIAPTWSNRIAGWLLLRARVGQLSLRPSLPRQRRGPFSSMLIRLGRSRRRGRGAVRSDEHTYELQTLMRTQYA